MVGLVYSRAGLSRRRVVEPETLAWLAFDAVVESWVTGVEKAVACCLPINGKWKIRVVPWVRGRQRDLVICHEIAEIAGAELGIKSHDLEDICDQCSFALMALLADVVEPASKRGRRRGTARRAEYSILYPAKPSE